MLWVVPEARSTAGELKAELAPKHWPGTAVRYGPFIKFDEARLGELLMHFMPDDHRRASHEHRAS